MKAQTLYRGSDNKKPKLSKQEKVYIFNEGVKRKALARLPKKETTTN